MTIVRISLAELCSASASMLAQAETTLQTEQKRTASNIATAIRDRSGLADGYWKAAHVARLRYEAAQKLHAALNDVSADRAHEGQNQ